MGDLQMVIGMIEDVADSMTELSEAQQSVARNAFGSLTGKKALKDRAAALEALADDAPGSTFSGVSGWSEAIARDNEHHESVVEVMRCRPPSDDFKPGASYRELGPDFIYWPGAARHGEESAGTKPEVCTVCLRAVDSWRPYCRRGNCPKHEAVGEGFPREEAILPGACPHCRIRPKNTSDCPVQDCQLK